MRNSLVSIAGKVLWGIFAVLILVGAGAVFFILLHAPAGSHPYGP